MNRLCASLLGEFLFADPVAYATKMLIHLATFAGTYRGDASCGVTEPDHCCKFVMQVG
jgi:hypothetical protein